MPLDSVHLLGYSLALFREGDSKKVLDESFHMV